MMWLTPTNGVGSGAYDGLAQLSWEPPSQMLTVYHASGRIRSYYNVAWSEVVAINAAYTATIATSATPDQEIALNVAGKYAGS